MQIFTLIVLSIIIIFIVLLYSAYKTLEAKLDVYLLFDAKNNTADSTHPERSYTKEELEDIKKADNEQVEAFNNMIANLNKFMTGYEEGHDDTE